MLEVSVTGMTCDHCAAAVTRAVEALPGVAAVQVDRARGTVRIDGTPDMTALQGAIEEEGYTLARASDR